jgi:hypothetical protein
MTYHVIPATLGSSRLLVGRQADRQLDVVWKLGFDSRQLHQDCWLTDESSITAGTSRSGVRDHHLWHGSAPVPGLGDAPVDSTLP